MASELKTLSDIRNAIIGRCKIDEDDTDLLNTIDGFINERYMIVGSAVEWSFAEEKRDLNIPEVYDTGTISVTNGSRTVTGAGTAWDEEEHVGWFISITGSDEHLQVVGVTSATEIQLSERYQGDTDAGLAYTLYKCEFGLPPDLEEVLQVMHSHNPFNKDVAPTSKRDYYRLMARSPDRTEYAQCYSLEGTKPYDGPPIGEFVVGYDFVGAGTAETRRILLYPRIPTAAYTMRISYTRRADPLLLDADEPLLELNHRWLLVWGALADYYDSQGNDNSATLWENRFQNGLKKLTVNTDATRTYPQLVVPNMYHKRYRRY